MIPLERLEKVEQALEKFINWDFLTVSVFLTCQLLTFSIYLKSYIVLWNYFPVVSKDARTAEEREDSDLYRVYNLV